MFCGAPSLLRIPLSRGWQASEAPVRPAIARFTLRDAAERSGQPPGALISRLNGRTTGTPVLTEASCWKNASWRHLCSGAPRDLCPRFLLAQIMSLCVCLKFMIRSLFTAESCYQVREKIKNNECLMDLLLYSPASEA